MVSRANLSLKWKISIQHKLTERFLRPCQDTIPIITHDDDTIRHLEMFRPLYKEAVVLTSAPQLWRVHAFLLILFVETESQLSFTMCALPLSPVFEFRWLKVALWHQHQGSVWKKGSFLESRVNPSADPFHPNIYWRSAEDKLTRPVLRMQQWCLSSGRGTYLIGCKSNMGGCSSASSMAVMPTAQMSHRWLYPPFFSTAATSGAILRGFHDIDAQTHKVQLTFHLLPIGSFHCLVHIFYCRKNTIEPLLGVNDPDYKSMWSTTILCANPNLVKGNFVREFTLMWWEE